MFLLQIRSGCGFMVHVCEDEYQLYSQFFTTHTTLLESVPYYCNLDKKNT